MFQFLFLATFEMALHIKYPPASSNLWDNKATSFLSHLSLVGACCPSGVRLYRMASNSLRVYWRSAGSSHSYITQMMGSSNNYTCTASPGESSCDVDNIQCGDVYNVVVSPLTPEGSKVLFCPQRLYSGMRAGSYSDVCWWKIFASEHFTFLLKLILCN